MNQRVISVLGLMNRPKWVIADEPTKARCDFEKTGISGVTRNHRAGYEEYDCNHSWCNIGSKALW